jgi:hypothetical protein
MAYENLTAIPDEFRAGDTIKWTQNLTNYQPDAWTLKYVFVKDGDQVIVTGTDNGDSSHLLTINLASAFESGTYKWSSYVTDEVDRHTIEDGRVEVLVNYETATSGYDDRSHIKKTLDALEAIIEGRASRDQESYSIAGRSLSRMPVPDLIQWRDKYKAYHAQEIKAERIKRGLGHSGRIEVRFK